VQQYNQQQMRQLQYPQQPISQQMQPWPALLAQFDDAAESNQQQIPKMTKSHKSSGACEFSFRNIAQNAKT
jgi:hypothetical protein